MCTIKRKVEEKILEKLSVVMLRCVFWNAPTIYYNIIMQRVRREKKLFKGTRARDSNNVCSDQTSSNRDDQRGLKKLQKEFRRMNTYLY